MGDEELIAWLRDLAAVLGKEAFTCAADRIEALVKERDEALEWLSASQGYIADAVFALDKQEKAEARAERLEAALKGLVEHCELTRDTAGFWKPRQVHQLSPTQWQSWCKQIKSARAALTTEEPK